MLSDLEFDQWHSEKNLSEQAYSLIKRIRFSPPFRNVGGGAFNVSGKYPSKKMGVTIQFESHTVELSSIYQMEHDEDVLEYYDQPERVKLRYHSQNNKVVGLFTTPDFFVIRKDSAGWEEWKKEEDLIELAEKSPNRYVREHDGTWRCPPGEEYAEQFGLYFHVRSSAEIDWVYQRNIRFIEDYLRNDKQYVTDEVQKKVLTLVKNNPGLKLMRLLETDGISADDIYSLIAVDNIYVNLFSEVLAEPDKVSVFIDERTYNAYTIMSSQEKQPVLKYCPISLQVGTTITWDGQPWTIINTGFNKTVLLSGRNENIVKLENITFETLLNQGEIVIIKDSDRTVNNEIEKMLEIASPEDLETASYRFQVISYYISERNVSAFNVSERTARLWLKQYKEAEQLWENGYVGLLPKRAAKGNRICKLPSRTKELMDQFIENEYENVKQKTKISVFGLLEKMCEDMGVVAPSYKTFLKVLNNRPQYEQILKRKGRRAAYNYEKFNWDLSMTVPRHGDRPFEICHIDHTELIIELVSSKGKRNLGKPWLTILTDAFSRRFLAVYLTFDPPSYRSCMMVLRECVRRHNRLPQTLVVDGGREFQSVYFDSFLARFECTKKTRPAAKARFGSVCERLFGTAQTQFISNLSGNTQLTRDNVRVVTKDVNPKTHAIWTIGDLYSALYEYVYEIYDNMCHPALGQTPKEAFDTGMQLCGFRPNRYIPFDEEFRIFTLPTTKKGNAKVHPSQGIKINNIYYWSNLFRDPGAANSQVPVRYDPFNVGIAYAFVGGQWVQCISEYYSVLNGRTEREILLCTEELKRQKHLFNKQFNVRAKQMAEFMLKVEEHETLLKQRTKDDESKPILTLINGKQRIGETSLNKDVIIENTPCFEGDSCTVEIDINSLQPLEEY